MTSPLGHKFGRYRIDAELGRGGMGVVYLATDPQLKRQVALKVVSAGPAASEEYVRRFEREAEVMAKVRSPHVVAIYDYGSEDGSPFLVSQYIDGGDLRDRIARGPLPHAQAVEITAQVAAALDAAHRAGVVHRDVKPSNVLVEDAPDGEVHAYLCDFGIAQPGDAEGLTQTGGVAGSWAYLSPERLNGEPATPASDIYALGCVLWACLTGRPPYGGTDTQVGIAHVNEPVPQMAGTDPETTRLNTILARSMAKDPAHRYASAQEMRRALIDPTAAGPIPAPPGRERPAGADHGRSRKGLLALVAAVVVLLLAGGAVVLLTRDGSEPKPSPDKKKPGLAGDFNGDGKGDIGFTVIGKSVTQRVNALSAGSSYGGTTVHKWEGGFFMFAADVVGDSRSDVVGVDIYDTASTHQVKVRVVDHAEGKSRTTSVPVPTSWPELFLVRPGDFDGDGKVDLAFSVVDGGKYQVWVSRGKETGFGVPTDWFEVADWTLAKDVLRAGDFDRDGKTDLAVLSDNMSSTDPKTPSVVNLLRSTGSAFVKSKTTNQTLARPPLLQSKSADFAVVVGDFTGDGHPDEVFVYQGEGYRRVDLTQWSDRGFSAPSTISNRAVPGLPSDIFGAEDIDGDGKADLVVLSSIGKGISEVSWQRSLGTSLAAPKSLMTYTSPLPRAYGGTLQTVF